MARRRRMTGCLAMALLAATLAGCSLIPSSGPVVRITQPPVVTGAPQVDIQPLAPAQDGTPDQILGGFLAAVSSGSANRFTVAREYLTPDAAKTWDPNQQVTVYDSNGHAPNVTDKMAALTAPVLGLVDAAGRYTSVSDPGFSHDFQMTQVDGQWRIGDPGTGIFVSQYTFEQAFRVVPIYFFASSGSRLLSENLYMNWGDASPTLAIEGLLKGPSTWLGPAAINVVPPQTKLAVSHVSVDTQGVAQISLTREVLTLSESQKVQMAAQFWWTLISFTSVTGLRIDAEGTPLTVQGQDADGVVRADTVSDYAPSTPAVSQDVFGLSDDAAVVRVPASAGAALQPLDGPLGTAWDDTPTQLAVSADGSTVALASATSLWIGSTTSAQAPDKAFDGVGLTRPQVNQDGTWVISQGADAADSPALWLVDPGGTQQHVDLTDLSGASVTAFRVAPDRTRIAVVTHMDGQDVLGLLRIQSLAPLTVAGWRPLVVNTDRGLLVTCLDVGWVSSSPEQLVVLATTGGDDSASAYRMDVDAAAISSMGPLSGNQPVALAVSPRGDGTTTAMALTSGGAVWRYEDTTRWTPLATGLAAIALPD